MLYDLKKNTMDSFEINKIVASILLNALLFIGFKVDTSLVNNLYFIFGGFDALN